MNVLRYAVEKIEKLPEDLRIFTLTPVKERLSYTPGHFAFLHLLDGSGKSLDKRPYSIASSPTQNHLEFCIKMVKGRFTTKLENVKKGDILGVEGPLGHFILTDDMKRCVFSGGGVGAAPFVSMLRYIADKKLDGDYHFFYCARRKASLAYYEELTGMQKKNPSIKLHFSLTREKPMGWKGLTGRLCGDVFREYIKEPEKYTWFICGPLAMTEAVKQAILDMDVPQEKIKMEGWG